MNKEKLCCNRLKLEDVCKIDCNCQDCDELEGLLIGYDD